VFARVGGEAGRKPLLDMSFGETGKKIAELWNTKSPKDKQEVSLSLSLSTSPPPPSLPLSLTHSLSLLSYSPPLTSGCP
jgi:hypothetical protein